MSFSADDSRSADAFVVCVCVCVWCVCVCDTRRDVDFNEAASYQMGLLTTQCQVRPGLQRGGAGCLPVLGVCADKARREMLCDPDGLQQVWQALFRVHSGSKARRTGAAG